jgi:hypothetical protein
MKFNFHDKTTGVIRGSRIRTCEAPKFTTEMP